MLRDGDLRSAEPGGLPILGKPVPRGGKCRNSRRTACRNSSPGADDLTPVPKNRQIAGSFAPRGGTARADFSRAASAPAARPPVPRRPPIAPCRPPASCGCMPKNLSGARTCIGSCGWSSVDSAPASDRLENWKTGGISIGSASSAPPSPFALWRSIDDLRRAGRARRRTGREVLG